MAIIIYALGSGRYPAIFDSSGSDITNTKKYWPAAHFGKVETVAVRPVKDDFTPYTKAELDEFVSFDFGLDNDWDTDTVPKIRTITGFSIQEVTVIMVEADPDNGIEEESITWAQIVFSVDYGTDEAKTALSTSPSLELDAELDGFREGETRPGLIIQFPHLLLGRLLESGTGTPNPVGDGTYSSAQIDALLRLGHEVQFSVDGETSWHDEQNSSDRYWQYRYPGSEPGGEWSEAIALIDNSDFSGYGTKAALVDADTVLENDSEDSGKAIVITMLKIWNYIQSKADAVYAAIVHSHAISDVTGLSGALDGKEDSLGFTAEDSANKGVANGYASLDANGKLPASQQNDNSVVRVVADIAARDALTDMIEGTECWVTDASADATVTLGAAKYLYSGSAWIKTAEAESMDVITAWSNVTSKPQIITEIASITGSDDDIIQKVSGSWISRTMAQLKTALGLDNVTNESKATMFANPAFTGSISTPIIKPAADSTTAVTLTKADGTTDVIVYDTVNKRLGIGVVPAATLDVNGSVHVHSTIYADRLYGYSGGYIQIGSGGGRAYFYTKICFADIAPSSNLHLKVGSATASDSPLKFTLTGAALNTTAEAGAVEADSSGDLYITNSSAVRNKINTSDGAVIREGSNCTMGTATLVAGTLTVSTTKVTANSRIMLSIQSLGTVTVPKAVGVTARTAATSFTITSADATDTSIIAWQIIEPL